MGVFSLSYCAALAWSVVSGASVGGEEAVQLGKRLRSPGEARRWQLKGFIERMERSSVTVPKPPRRNVIRIKVGFAPMFARDMCWNPKQTASTYWQLLHS